MHGAPGLEEPGKRVWLVESSHACGSVGRHEAATIEQAGIAGPGRAGTGDARAGCSHDDHAGRLDRVLARVADRVGAGRFERYLGGREGVRLHEGGVEITVPDRTTAELIDRCVSEDLRRALAAEDGFGGAPEVRFRVEPRGQARGETRGEGRATREPAPAAPPVRTRRHRAERPLKTLDGFVVGESNRIAYAAARAVAEGAPVGADLVAIHGGCGLGKTHLLEGIAHAARRRGARVRLTSGDAFTGEFVRAIRAGSTAEFQRRHRGVDVLCVDDAHFLAGRGATQVELVHTIEALRSTGATIVLVTDHHPSEVERLQAALVSRLIAGLVVRVDPPEASLRGALVRRLALERGMTLSEEAAHLVASGAGASVRAIEGALAQVLAVARVSGAGPAIGAATAAAALGGRAGAGRERSGPIAVEAIAREVCAALGVAMGELLGRGRTARVVLAREVTVELATRLSNRSFPEIARAMGRTNHSTPLTQVKKIRGLMADGAVVRAGCELDGVAYAEAVDRLEARVRASA